MKIGLMLPIGTDEGRDPLAFATLAEMALTAEEGSLDSVWAADHLVMGKAEQPTGIHECWTLLAALAAVTQRVEIGPMVLAVPFRNPALTAKMATELDEVSSGRLILGLGCGWHRPEFDGFDYPFDHRVSRFEEALSIIVPLLRSGRVSFEGRYHRAETALLPRGPRQSGPPILIAGKGPRMMSLVARHADQWNAAWYGRPDQAAELDARLEALRAALQEAGRESATLARTVGLFVAFPSLLGSTDEPPATAIHGEPDEVGRQLAGYADRRIAHLIVHVWPRTPQAVADLGRAASVARELVGDATPA